MLLTIITTSSNMFTWTKWFRITPDGQYFEFKYFRVFDDRFYFQLGHTPAICLCTYQRALYLQNPSYALYSNGCLTLQRMCGSKTSTTNLFGFYFKQYFKTLNMLMGAYTKRQSLYVSILSTSYMHIKKIKYGHIINPAFCIYEYLAHITNLSVNKRECVH